MDIAHLETPIGILRIEGDTHGLKKISFVEKVEHESKVVSPNTQLAVNELRDYFSKSKTSFTIKIAPKGTAFQQKVWQELQSIPFGKTTSYKQMAHRLGDPKVIRAAATANGKNPIAIVIPCHRVIGSDGSLTGYAGGLHRKKWLLTHESPITQGEFF